MTNPCEHKNIELLYTTFVSDGIDTVCKCKDCGAELIAKGRLVHLNTGHSFVNKSKPVYSMGCQCELPDCSICGKDK